MLAAIFTPPAVGFAGIGDPDKSIIFTNVRVAKGGNMNMLGKKFTETKIVTHGITFDIDKSDIKPQSTGTLNMIVKIMKNNPDLKFEIAGHKDNSGEAAHNLTLSHQRSRIYYMISNETIATPCPDFSGKTQRH